MAISGMVMWAFLFLILYFQVMLLMLTLSRWDSSKKGSSKRTLSHYPTIEIIVPCWNEEHTIAGTLRSLLSLSYPKDKLRITVVNDGSTDGSVNTLARFKDYKRINIVNKANGGKHSAVNYAIERSSADIIGCLDADSFVRPDALREIVNTFNTHPAMMAVTPGIKVTPPKTFLAYMQKAEYEIGVLFRKVFAEAHGQFITPGPFSFYRREVFETIGLFKSAYNTEDLEMGLRMQKNNMHIGNNPNAVVYTNTPARFIPLFKQRVRWAYGFLGNAVEYRNLFFNVNNVFLGFILLPVTFLSIIVAAYLPLALIYNVAVMAINKANEVSVIGLQAFMPTIPSYIDWFSFSPTVTTYIVVALAIFATTLVLMGKRIGGEKVSIDRGLIFYVTCYGFLAPLWLTKAVFDAVFARGNRWR